MTLADVIGGHWRLTRRVADSRLGITGHAHGAARFSPIAGALRYEEHANLVFGTWRGLVTQAHTYVLAGPVAHISFADGRPFHDLDLSGPQAAVTHLCGHDTYRGTFRVQTPDRWTVRWHVEGPRKRQCIVTRFQRVSGLPDSAPAVMELP